MMAQNDGIDPISNKKTGRRGSDNVSDLAYMVVVFATGFGVLYGLVRFVHWAWAN